MTAQNKKLTLGYKQVTSRWCDFTVTNIKLPTTLLYIDQCTSWTVGNRNKMVWEGASREI